MAAWAPPPDPPTHPPTHIRKFFRRKQMKFIKGARNWRSIGFEFGFELGPQSLLFFGRGLQIRSEPEARGRQVLGRLLNQCTVEAKTQNAIQHDTRANAPHQRQRGHLNYMPYHSVAAVKVCSGEDLGSAHHGWAAQPRSHTHTHTLFGRERHTHTHTHKVRRTWHRSPTVQQFRDTVQAATCCAVRRRCGVGGAEMDPH